MMIYGLWAIAFLVAWGWIAYTTHEQNVVHARLGVKTTSQVRGFVYVLAYMGVATLIFWYIFK